MQSFSVTPQSYQTPPPYHHHPSSLYELEARYQKPERFPDSVFPQLRSLKKKEFQQKSKRQLQQEHFREVIFEQSRRQKEEEAIREEALRQENSKTMHGLDWTTRTRVDRPFEGSLFRSTPIRTNGYFDSPRPSRPSTPRLYKEKPKEPTAYYLEQLELAREPVEPIPVAAQEAPTVVLRGPASLFVIYLVTQVIMPFLDVATIACSNFVHLLLFILVNIFHSLKKLLRTFLKLTSALQWDVVLAMVLAAQVTKWLPRIDGKLGVGRGNEMGIGSDKSVYIIMVPNQPTIGTGSGFVGSWM